MRKLWENKVSRRKLLGGAAATGAAIPVLHEMVPHQNLHGGTSAAQAAVEHHRQAHRGSGHLGAMGRGSARANGFDPHTIHFHGIHRDVMDGVPGVGAGNIGAGESTVYEFDAEPFGLHLYHCHSTPLAEHIAKGLYGAFVIDPKDGRRPADELLMVMNGFDTNFDRSNEVYAVNTVAFAYINEPIQVRRGELVRIYLVNALEFDLVNSFHVHANFFDYFPTGTSLEPTELTDTVIQGQGQRGILELRFPYTGKYMFHAHVSEFAELGWMGFFEVVG